MFEITRNNGCVIVKGNVPVSRIAKLASQAPRGAVLSSELARLLDAVLVFGLPSDINDLLQSLNKKAVSREPALPPAKTERLSCEAMNWLEKGSRGASSESMFTHFTKKTGLAEGYAPADVGDFRRCRLLLEQVPEFVSLLPSMAEVSDEWERLISKWDELCSLMDSEAPQWRGSKGRAPRTGEMIRAIHNIKICA